MEITKEDAERILWWALVAEGESQYRDATNLMGRMKKAFPSLASKWEGAFFSDEAIAKQIELTKCQLNPSS